ncbi:MAG: hypothetical protein J6P07_00250 [Spirochaetaceae bacterium]|nr:hypothetical protein [Spirochaetaceae bacterium]MBO7731953.1 hypothetical protein [Methanobrevibacter sp.]
MTKDDISKIKEHIEIHARQEPRAVKITEILWRAVGELEHITELEKENTGLKLMLEALEGETPWKDIKDKSELIKENAELKEQNRSYEQLLDTGSVTLMKERLKNYKQLTKAKEILAKLLEEEKNNMYWEMNGSDKSSYYEVRKQAEQFLNSEVEK